MPCCTRPIFAASAAHSILLEPGVDVEVQLAEAAGGDHQAQLQLEVRGVVVTEAKIQKSIQI